MGVAAILIPSIILTYEMMLNSNNVIDDSHMPKSYPVGFRDYITSNLILKDILASNDIDISSPIKLSTQNLIEEYCLPFIAEKEHSMIEYCTSTELKNSDSEFLGNIHMAGSLKEPNLILGAIQIDPFLTQERDAKKILNSMILAFVCNCWKEQKPLNFDSLNSLLDEANQIHLETLKPKTISPIITLEDKQLQFIIITNEQGYEWQFLITNDHTS
jgi:hypothetical protein